MQVWNLSEAAKFLRMSAYTLREQASAGKVPGVKVAVERRVRRLVDKETKSEKLRDM